MERGYVIRPLREVLRTGHRIAAPSRTVVVTFDDGFCIGSRLLRGLFLKEFKRRLPFSSTRLSWTAGSRFRLTVGLAHRQRLPAEYYRPLTSAECREMAEDGLVELGSHTHTHIDFRSRPAALRQDTQTSVDL